MPRCDAPEHQISRDGAEQGAFDHARGGITGRFEQGAYLDVHDQGRRVRRPDSADGALDSQFKDALDGRRHGLNRD